jgi:hypothetical protein
MKRYLNIIAVLFIAIGSIYAYFIIDILKMNEAFGFNIPTVLCAVPAIVFYINALLFAVLAANDNGAYITIIAPDEYDEYEHDNEGVWQAKPYVQN